MFNDKLEQEFTIYAGAGAIEVRKHTKALRVIRWCDSVLRVLCAVGVFFLLCYVAYNAGELAKVQAHQYLCK